MFFCLLTSAENYKRAPGNLLRAYFPCQVFCGGIKNHQITCQKREPPLCVLFYTLENLLITSVRDLCRKRFSNIFPLRSNQNPEQCIKENFVKITTVLHSDCFHRNQCDFLILCVDLFRRFVLTILSIALPSVC